MPKAHTRTLTQDIVDRTKPTSGRDIYLTDSDVAGLRVKITPKGKRVFSYRYRSPVDGRQRTMAIKTTRLSEARKEARRSAIAIDENRDPQEEKDRLGGLPSLEVAFEAFLSDPRSTRRKDGTARQRKDSTLREYRRIFAHSVPARLKRRVVSQVTRRDISELIRSMSDRPAMANAVQRVLSAFFSWCEDEAGYLKHGTNPASRVARYPDRKRSFVFEGDQLFRLGQVLDQVAPKHHPASIEAIRLYIFTGMRREEVLTLRWEYIDLQKRVISLADTKTGARDVPLGSEAVKIIQRLKKISEAAPSPWVIPSPTDRTKRLVNISKLWNKVRKLADLDGVRIHDLRHNYGGQGAATTKDPTRVKTLLGHKALATTDRYMKLARAPAQEAADDVNEAIAAQMKPANVLRFGGHQ